MMIGGVWKGRHFLSLRPLSNESEKDGRGGEVGRKGWAKILKVHRVYRAGNDLRRSSPSDLSKDTRNLRGASARASSESRSVYVSHLPSNQTQPPIFTVQRIDPPILFAKDTSRFYYNISFFLSRILCSQARFLDSIDISEVANFFLSQIIPS